MEIQEHRHGAVTVVRPRGPLVEADAGTLRDCLREVTARCLGRFVLDASEIPFADSAGLEMLAEAGEELASSGQALRVAAPSETLREVFDLTDIAGGFEIFADVQTAVRSFL